MKTAGWILIWGWIGSCSSTAEPPPAPLETPAIPGEGGLELPAIPPGSTGTIPPGIRPARSSPAVTEPLWSSARCQELPLAMEMHPGLAVWDTPGAAVTSGGATAASR